MKLQNKKTGEIIELLAKPSFVKRNDDYLQGEVNTFNSLAELNEEWEDYEEPKDNNYWYIDDFGRIQFSSELLDEVEGKPNNWMARKLFGNYFETKEEVEKAVEKLRAWKRLKDKGFRFDVTPALGHCDDEKFDISIIATMPSKWWYNDKVVDDIHYVFGGEDDNRPH